MREAYDALEQCGRRNCLIFHGIDEVPNKGDGESTDGKIIDVINDKLAVKINPSDIERSHRLMRKIQTTKPRPITVKFSSYNMKAEVYRQKRKFKGTGIVITESLTKIRLKLYHIVSKHAKVETAWTSDGKITALLSGSNRKVTIENDQDLLKLPDS